MSLQLIETMICELTSHEASLVSGGFEITNDTRGTRTFFPFSASSVPTRRTLAPGASGTYTEDYVLFNSTKNGFNPVVQPASGSLSFAEEDNSIFLRGIAEFRSPDS
ncbi:hypothetical protein IQ274_28510 [Nostoc sp. LEGE 12447]|uniref:hypothetical protein n=1 Tax=Nostoc sp. LEGE 12447 TaxID=1828640 RepID=UPI00188412E7|nr:hypothetical protein [Nostoc sp. LEGE 12447]MBE9002039.1 hypothetical protein [Nostoc sp. LEGE 12447]